MRRNVAHRREQILALISAETVHTQEELAAALRRRGVEASQTSLSRDVAALRLVKVAGRYAAPAPAEVPEDPAVERLQRNLLSVARAGENLLVLKTPAGEASGLALALDRMVLPGVVGTVAGDDTILAAVASAAAGREVARRLREIVGRPLATDDGEEGS